MPVILGVDLGTTKITCIAVDTTSGDLLAVATAVNDANITREEDRARGHSEWRADLILVAANRCLANVAKQLGPRVRDVAGIGVTGQQHGVVLVNAATLRPLSPLINWQDLAVEASSSKDHRASLDCVGCYSNQTCFVRLFTSFFLKLPNSPKFITH